MLMSGFYYLCTQTCIPHPALGEDKDIELMVMENTFIKGIS